jgi:hypothetical protein
MGTTFLLAVNLPKIFLVLSAHGRPLALPTNFSAAASRMVDFYYPADFYDERDSFFTDLLPL